MTTRGNQPVQTGITYVHQKTHEGRFFSGGYYNASVANAATLDILLQTDATHSYHMVAEAASGGDATMALYEGATVSNAGTAVAMSNHNTASSKVFPHTTTHTPTVTGTGTAMNGTIFIPGGGPGASSSGASGSFAEEFVLKPNTIYLLRITNVSGGAKAISATIKGYIPDL